MNLLGFYLGRHDSNLTLYNGKVCYVKSERLYQIKHHWADLKWIKAICEDYGFMPDAVAFSDGNRNNLKVCDKGCLNQEVKEFNLFGKTIPVFCVDHHYAHILSAWPIRSIKNVDYGITIDGRGDHSSRVSIIQNPGSENPIIIMQSQDYALPNKGSELLQRDQVNAQ